VSPAAERVQRSAQTCIEISARGRGHARRKRGSVELVIGAQNERAFKRSIDVRA
jgi:hypothetical protein